MTPKSLFIIIVRVMGLLLIVGMLQAIPELIQFLGALAFNGGELSLLAIFLFVSVILTYFYIAQRFLIRADKLVSKFALADNFDEEIFDVNIDQTTIVKIAIVFVGGYTMIHSFVPLLLSIYAMLQNWGPQEPFYINRNYDFYHLVYHTLMLLIGYYLMGNSKTIVSYIESKEKSKLKEN